MRLTKDIRESIAKAAVTESFEKRRAELAKKEHDLGMEFYKGMFDAAVLKKVNALPKEWTRQDSCLRFNAGGYDLRFTVSPAVPVPASSDCGRLGSLEVEAAKKAQDHAHDKRKFSDEYSAAHRATINMLESVSSIKTLEKAWPEGRKFYVRYITMVAGTNLPAVQVSKINEMLGIKAAK